MPDLKISAGADPGTLVATDRVPLARSASTTAYAATIAELASFTSAAYVPNYYTGSPSMDGSAAPGSLAFVSRGDHVHPSDTSRLALAGGTMAGFLTLNANPTANLHAATKQYVDGSAPVGGPYLSVAAMHDVGRNLIHNAGFTVAQRGAGPFMATAYSLDRWLLVVTGDTSGFSRSANPASSPIGGDEGATWVGNMSYTGNAAAGSYTRLAQPIEDVRRLSGKTVTVSFYAYCSTALKLGVSLDQYFGSGGSPSATVQGAGQSVTLAAAWTRYSMAFVLPSVSGKTIGTNNDHSTYMNLWFSSGATNNTFAGGIGVQSGNPLIWGVQLEIGSVATPLEKRDPVLELQQCQRFYQIGNMWTTGAVTAGGIGITALSNLPVTMRTNPVVTPTVTAATNVTGTTVTSYGFGAVIIQATSSAAGGYIAQASYTASADL